MKSFAQLEASIERFRRSFWLRETMDRPPVGVIPARAWLPIQYVRGPLRREELLSEDVGNSLARTDYEDTFATRPVESDDFLPYVAAWRAVPWLEAMCGCPVRTSAGSLAPGRCVRSAEELETAAIPSGSGWMETLHRETVRLSETAPQDCWVSPSILRGPSRRAGRHARPR